MESEFVKIFESSVCVHPSVHAHKGTATGWNEVDGDNLEDKDVKELVINNVKSLPLHKYKNCQKGHSAEPVWRDGQPIGWCCTLGKKNDITKLIIMQVAQCIFQKFAFIPNPALSLG